MSSMNWKGSTEIWSVSKDSFKLNPFVNKTREFHTGANLVIIPKIYRKSNIFLSNNSTDHTYIHTYLSHPDLQTRVGRHWEREEDGLNILALLKEGQMNGKQFRNGIKHCYWLRCWSVRNYSIVLHGNGTKISKTYGTTM